MNVSLSDVPRLGSVLPPAVGAAQLPRLYFDRISANFRLSHRPRLTFALKVRTRVLRARGLMIARVLAAAPPYYLYRRPKDYGGADRESHASSPSDKGARGPATASTSQPAKASVHCEALAIGCIRADGTSLGGELGGHALHCSHLHCQSLVRTCGIRSENGGRPHERI